MCTFYVIVLKNIPVYGAVKNEYFGLFSPCFYNHLSFYLDIGLKVNDCYTTIYN